MAINKFIAVEFVGRRFILVEVKYSYKQFIVVMEKEKREKETTKKY